MARSNAFDAAKQALHAHASSLLTLYNVSAVGIGMKVRGEQSTGELSVKCFVPRKIPSNELLPGAMVPAKLGVSGGYVQTDVEEMQPPTAPPWLIDPYEYRFALAVGNKERLRPFSGGASISSIRSLIGTTACAVLDKFGGVAALSCNHVLDALNRGIFGDPVLQPAIDDYGTLPSDRIGFLMRWQPIVFGSPTGNLVDAAIAHVKRGDITPFINFVGMPAGARSGNQLKLGSRVVKVGRTTALTRGFVTAVHVKGWINYPPILGGAGPAFFEEQIVTTAMAGFGDSGSLLLDEDLNAVGLLFGGSSTHTFYNDIVNVQEALGILIPRNL
jgi:hypothetical protein